MLEYLLAFKYYLLEILPYLAIGFLLSGLIHEFVPSSWITRRLGGGGIKPILYSTVISMLLPMCCFSALPVAVSLREKGAKLGPVLAFLVAAPAVSVVSLILAYSILGLKFMTYIFFAVIVTGLVTGLVGDAAKRRAACFVPVVQASSDPVCQNNAKIPDSAGTESDGAPDYTSCSRCQQTFGSSPNEPIKEPQQLAHRVKGAFRYAYVDMVKEIGPELLLGLALTALITAIAPVREFVSTHLSGGLGYVFSLGFGLIKHTSSITSVHLVDAFLSQGMNVGAGMVLLLAGPITSWGTILVLRKEFGGRILAIYLTVVCTLSLLLGYCFSLL